MAGLPSSRACVSVGPPLSSSGPSMGSPLKLVGALMQVPSSTMLYPASVTVPKFSQSVSALFATMLFLSVNVPKE